MPAVIVEVAEALKDVLNSQEFSMCFKACRNYADWDISLETSPENKGKVFCDVVPVTPDEVTRLTRGALDYRAPVDVVFRRVIEQSERGPDGRVNVSVIDALCEFSEEVFDGLTRNVPSLDAVPAVRVERDWRSAYGATDAATDARLRLQNQWTSVFRMTYHATVE